MTNQRETTVLWDRRTGKPLHPALLWLDTRTADLVEHYVATAAGGKDALRERTGLPLSTYFSAVKVRWLVDHIPAVMHAIRSGVCMFGTIDSWLIWVVLRPLPLPPVLPPDATLTLMRGAAPNARHAAVAELDGRSAGWRSCHRCHQCFPHHAHEPLHGPVGS